MSNAASYYFYDLETSSGSPFRGRIMQFGGQRTDLELRPIGEPQNELIALCDDVLPDPDAILVHGITPQKTREYGLTEAEFVHRFLTEIALPGTIFVGFNNIRFDDEFMRRLCYRNFVDPYEWHWKEGRSRWDLMDPLRMMRALRPDGLRWPVLDGKPTVKLELLAKENGVSHESAHDALSDVRALLQIAQRFHENQPKLFEYVVKMRDKREVAGFVDTNDMFVYTSGKYSSDYEKTTVVQRLFHHPRRDAAIVYNLREDPTPWLDKTEAALAQHWQVRYGDELEPLPIKTLQYNRCPAIAPLRVLDDVSRMRLAIDMKQIQRHHDILKDNPDFIARLQDVLDRLEHTQQTALVIDEQVDNQLYDGFWSEAERRQLDVVRSHDPATLHELLPQLRKKRMRELLPLYKARNYPNVLSTEERLAWEQHCRHALLEGGEKSQTARFGQRLQQLTAERSDERSNYLLTELQLYAESIIPFQEELSE